MSPNEYVERKTIGKDISKSLHSSNLYIESGGGNSFCQICQRSDSFANKMLDGYCDNCEKAAPISSKLNLPQSKRAKILGQDLDPFANSLVRNLDEIESDVHQKASEVSPDSE
jgi:hypothetical protein